MPASEPAPFIFFLEQILFEMRNSKFKINKSSAIGGFEAPKVRKKNSKDCQISRFGFECGAKNIDIWFLARFG